MLTVFLCKQAETGDEQVPSVQLTLISSPNWYIRRLNRIVKEERNVDTLATLRFPTRTRRLSKTGVKNIRKLEEVLTESYLEGDSDIPNGEGHHLLWATNHIIKEVAQKAYMLGFKNGQKAKRKK